MKMTDEQLKTRYYLIALIATRQASERGYETGFEEKAQKMGLL